MEHSKSAAKRMRQNQKARLRNKARKSTLKTQIKKVDKALDAEDVELAKTEARKAVSLLDRAGHKRLIHPNKAARKKSQIARMINSA